ncbi:uncharacterized protein LOC117480811 [Trematomus bernacchii]|uniref:uncharacterized protein LOC117480811 n=1 Tax=Trematomus bernacchii TaxID=40690 RepID=UPI00146C7402|nr:uncharacterized protein LOC117480811 [Trematomus bernacchii]
MSQTVCQKPREEEEQSDQLTSAAALMVALTSAQHAGLFMFLWIIGSVAAGEMLKKNAKLGEDVTLQCNSPTDAAITLLEWSRPELKDDYVFYFRDNRLYDNYQDPRYHGRVELKDPEMKNGDASVLLKNVDIDDTGTYECRVITPSNNRRKRNLREFVHSIHLIVSEGPEKEINDEHHQYGDANDEPPGGHGGDVGLAVGLGLVCLMVGVGVGVGLVVKSKRAQLNRSLESVDVKLNPRHVPDLFTPDCPPSPASKLNHLLPESLPCRGGGAYKPSETQTPGQGYTKCDSISNFSLRESRNIILK